MQPLLYINWKCCTSCTLNTIVPFPKFLYHILHMHVKGAMGGGEGVYTNAVLELRN